MNEKYEDRIVIYPDERLNTPTVMVNKDAELGGLIETMFETMEYCGGIGLSANQIGRKEAVFIGLINGESRVFINPRDLKAVSSVTQTVREGCLSFPGFFLNIKRYYSVELTYEDAAFNTRTDIFDGLWAACVQHEYDHLSGVTFLDRTSSYHVERAKKKIKATMRRLKKNNV